LGNPQAPAARRRAYGKRRPPPRPPPAYMNRPLHRWIFHIWTARFIGESFIYEPPASYV